MNCDVGEKHQNDFDLGWNLERGDSEERLVESNKTQIGNNWLLSFFSQTNSSCQVVWHFVQANSGLGAHCLRPVCAQLRTFWVFDNLRIGIGTWRFHYEETYC